MSPTRRIILTSVLLFAATEALLLIHIQYPDHENFDEFHYVKAARALLDLSANTNWEHPPLAKYLIAAGMKVAGDRPFGWRLMPALFGSLSVVGMYLWALLLFRRQSTAAWVALLSMLNGFLFVMGRVAMLDVFMFAFLLYGIIAVTALWHARDRKQADRLLVAAGVMFGLSMACKWFALAPWVFSLLLIVFIRTLQRSGSTLFRSPQPGTDEWYTPDTFRHLDWTSILVGLVVLPTIVYLATFVPLRWVPGPKASWSGLLRMQRDISYGQSVISGWHPYSSFWWQWPATRRPMWFAYDAQPNDREHARGVILLGNPAIMWGGLLAVAICLWHWLRARSRTAFFGFAWWVTLYLCWAWVPRTLTFYYYYFPAAMTLSIALACVVEHWRDRRWMRWGQWLLLAVSLIMFIGLYPFYADLVMPASVMPAG